MFIYHIVFSALPNLYLRNIKFERNENEELEFNPSLLVFRPMTWLSGFLKG